MEDLRKEKNQPSGKKEGAAHSQGGKGEKNRRLLIPPELRKEREKGEGGPRKKEKKRNSM